MPIDIIENYNLKTNLPLDARYIVNNINDVSSYWYSGMQLFQLSDIKLYWYDGSIWHNIDSSTSGDYVKRSGDTMYGPLEFSRDSSYSGGIISSPSDGLLKIDASLGIGLKAPYIVFPDASDNVGAFLKIGPNGIIEYTSIDHETKIWEDELSTDQTISTTSETSILSVIPDEDVSFGSLFYDVTVDLPWWRSVWLRLYIDSSLYIEDEFTGNGTVDFSDSLPIQNAGISSGSTVSVTIESDIDTYTVKTGSLLKVEKFGLSTGNVSWGQIDGSIQDQTDLYDWLTSLDSSIERIDTSLGDYVRKDGDTMTGPLETPWLTVGNDVSIVGSLYLGDTSSNSGVEKSLLAVVDETGKITATTIPSSNVSSEVIDVSADIDVSILRGYYYVDTSAGDVTLTIPDPSTENDGKMFGILKKTDDLNVVYIKTQSTTRQIGNSNIQTITQKDKGISIVSDYDNDKWLIVQDSRYLEGSTQGEFQYWDVSTRSWLPTTSDITWDNTNLHFNVGGNSTPPTFQVDASQDIVYINANDISVNNPTDDLGFYAGGRGAFGNAVTIDRLRANVPGNVPRALSLIDTTGVMRIWRFVNNLNDPAVEFVWGTEDTPGDPSNNWWDMFLDGDGTGNDSFSIRSRTAPYGNLKLLTIYRDHTQIESTTESSSPSSGSLQVFGGAGVDGNLNTTGAINPGGSGSSSTSFPTTGINSGSMFYRTDLNMLFVYDGSRGKWLSTERATYTAGSDRVRSSVAGYLEVGSAAMSSDTGFRMLRNGTITGASIQNRSTLSSSRQCSIRVNDSSVYTLNIPNATTGTSANNINVNFNKDDIIQIVLEQGGSTMRDIIGYVEVAWRE